MKPFCIELKPSKLLWKWGNALHLLVLIAVCIAFSGWYLIVFLVLVLSAWLWFVYQIKNKMIKQINIDPAGTATLLIYQNGLCRQKKSQIIGISLPHPSCFWITWEIDSSLMTLAILPDSSDKQSLRQLYMWAKWSRHHHNLNHQVENHDAI